MRERRGGVYARGGVLWIWYWDGAGNRRAESTGLPVGQEKVALAALAAIRARIAAGAELGAIDGRATVRAWGQRWIERRKARDLSMAGQDERRLALYIYPGIGAMAVEDVRPRHVAQLVEDLQRRPSARGGTLAPRTVRHAYATLRRLMGDAVRKELIQVSPCVLDRNDLPSVVDKDPEWRGAAVFTRAELETLLSHPDIPHDRRVVYALLGLAGLRWGELAALRWRAYDTAPTPLGRLTISAAYSRHRKAIGRTKTGATRPVPVHPTLARVLAEWKLSGWPLFFGRAPGPDDFLVPSRAEGEGEELRLRSGVRALRRLLEDLGRLGLRPRRLHDLRRTFISLAQDDGASPEVLRWVTHTPAHADIVASYTTLRWPTLCEAVGKLQVELREGQVVPLRAAASARATALLQPGAAADQGTRKPRKSRDLRGSRLVGETGFEPATPWSRTRCSTRLSHSPALPLLLRVPPFGISASQAR